jgi:hypothetical protein
LRKQELQKDKSKNSWKDLLANPVTIAVVGGIITLFTAVITNYFNSSETRQADEAKARLAQESAKETLQADLIKKFVEGPKPEAVRENLRFLVDAGLIPDYASSIKKYLDSNPQAAPQIGAGIEFSPSGVSIADEVKKRLQIATNKYVTYLRNLGFPNLDQNVSVFIYSDDKPAPGIPSTSVNAFYMNDKYSFMKHCQQMYRSLYASIHTTRYSWR